MEWGFTDAEIASLDSEQWAALFEMRAEREKRQDWRFGVIAATLANCHRDSQKHPDPFEPQEFFSSLRDPEPPPPPKLGAPELKQQLIAIAQAFKGEVEE